MVGSTIGFTNSNVSTFEHKIDLNKELISHPVSTFLFRAGQDLDSGVKVKKGDVIIVDRSWNLAPGHNVIFSNSDNLLIGQLFKEKNRFYIRRGGKVFEVGDDIEVWGKVTYVIHRV